MNKRNSVWNFDNSYTRLPESMFSRVNPTVVSAPKMVLWNEALAKSLGLSFKQTSESDLAALFSGNILPIGADSIAQAYAGHQYGHPTMLGDGRAVLLGEHLTPQGKRVDIQLKGSGRTPYSRQGDGRAALGPMLREYLMSEAMNSLNIATTRSLAVVLTGDEIFRGTLLPGAILTRVAASHLRIGTFEYAAMRGDNETLRTLVFYAIQRHYPHLKEAENPALELLNAVIERQITLVIEWMRVGFIHGVMNTDNVTISGETIDYGPCAFMDSYDPNTVFSSIDRHGRYAFGNQPKIMHWNLARFAETLLPILHKDPKKSIQIAEDVLNNVITLYQNSFLTMMRKKLGFLDQEIMDEELIREFLIWMQENRADYTNTFRALTADGASQMLIFQEDKFRVWYQRWQARLLRNSCSQNSVFEIMKKNNPAVIPRNHIVEEALQAASIAHDLSPLQRLLEVLVKPYDDDEAVLAVYKTPGKEDDFYQTFCGT